MTIIRDSPADRTSMDASLVRVCEYMMSLSSKERLHKAGILSGNFWLST
jgi:hypothetical protein